MYFEERLWYHGHMVKAFKRPGPKPKLPCAEPNCLSRKGPRVSRCALHQDEYKARLDARKADAAERKRNYWQRRALTRKVDSYGYVMVRIDGGPWIHEHRYVLEQKLGRPLARHESAHHVNGVRDDNEPENLELWVGAIRYGQRATDIRCHNCGEAYAI